MAALREQLASALGTRFVVERELGGGGMSRVFLAREAGLDRPVVIKVLPPELAGVNLERFRREIQLAAGLQHPHIVPVHAAGEADGLLFYTMPWVQGESLRDRLARGERIPVEEAVRILRDVIGALAYAHERGVVHRDVKPDNVLMSGGHALVTDFGVAKALSAANTPSASKPMEMTGAGVAVGTPAYMAPEQAAGDPDTDHRADLYAFGLLAYELLAGRSPFAKYRRAQEVIAAQLNDRPAPIESVREDVPDVLAQLVARCLEKRPDDRPHDAAEVRRTLDAIATGEGAALASGGRWRRARRARAAVIGGAMVAIAAIAATWGWRTTHAVRADHATVAVAPFRLAGADPALAYLREGMVDLLAAKLTGEGGPRSADPRAVLRAWSDAAGSDTIDLPRERALRLAEGLGAGQLLLGEVTGTAQRLVVSARLLDVHDGRAAAQSQVSGPADSLPQLVDRLAGELLAINAGEGARLASLTSTSLPALRAYLTGQALFRRGRYQAAGTEFERALGHDSTFALAGVSLVRASNWYGDLPANQRGGRLAWTNRERLSARDRALLESLVGRNYPAPADVADQIAANERYRDLAPERADAWFELGDVLFHGGAVVGMTNAHQQAADAFRRALAIDSTYAPALEHLVLLAARAGDTASAQRYAERYLALDSAGESAMGVRWRLATIRADSGTIRELARPRTDLAPTSMSVMGWVSLQDGVDVARGAAMIRAIGEHQASQGEAGAFIMLHDLELLLGHPARALAMLERFEAQQGPAPRERLKDALANDGDPAAADSAVRVLAADFDKDQLPGQPIGYHVANQCLVSLWRAVGHDDTTTLRRSVQRLRATAAQGSTPPARAAVSPAMASYASGCALLLEATIAVRGNAPDAALRLARADSVLRRGPANPLSEFGNPVLARLWERAGKVDRALAAIRRRPYFSGRAANLAASLREEGRLAQRAGRDDEAIAAWRHYLTLRAAPDVAFARDVEGIREELARLERRAAGS